jgi:hypothetical protein
MAGEPLPLELRLGLRAGSVFYFQSRELTSEQPHFFIVVNRDPLGTKLVLVAIVTSKLDKVRLRNRERPETVVEITPAEYDEFKLVSAVDCNVVLDKPLDELAGMVRRKEVRYHKDLPPAVFAKIRTAVLASPVILDEIKQLI